MVTITKGDQCMRLRAHAAHIHATEQRINNRRGQAFDVNLAVRAVDILNAAAGGDGLQMPNPIRVPGATSMPWAAMYRSIGTALARCMDKWLWASKRAVSTRVV
jgi:hypothetical protein